MPNPPLGRSAGRSQITPAAQWEDTRPSQTLPRSQPAPAGTTGKTCVVLFTPTVLQPRTPPPRLGIYLEDDPSPKNGSQDLGLLTDESQNHTIDERKGSFAGPQRGPEHSSLRFVEKSHRTGHQRPREGFTGGKMRPREEQRRLPLEPEGLGARCQGIWVSHGWARWPLRLLANML